MYEKQDWTKGYEGPNTSCDYLYLLNNEYIIAIFYI